MVAFLLRRWLMLACVNTAVLGGLLYSSLAFAVDTAQPPQVGEVARDFTLNSVDDRPLQLSQLQKKGRVVLVVLRGYPGYQCPVCNSQVGQFLTSAKEFAAAKATVLFVYPGAADGLKKHAQDFLRGKTLPENFSVVIDPDYSFTNTYQLRWEAKNETAYPATFVIEPDGKIKFTKISKSHGGRASAQEVLQALANDK